MQYQAHTQRFWGNKGKKGYMRTPSIHSNERNYTGWLSNDLRTDLLAECVLLTEWKYEIMKGNGLNIVQEIS